MTVLTRWMGLLLAVVLASGLFGCEKIADAVGKKAKKEADKAIAQAADPASAPGAPGGAAKMDLFTDASPIAPKLKEKIGGPVRMLELVVYPEYAIADIQNPNKKLEADQYKLRNGVVDDGSPLKFTGRQPTEADLARTTFALEEVDFTQVPKIAKDAVVALGFEDAKTTHMILERRSGGQVRWRVYVNSPRRSGSVEFDLKGVKGKVWN